MLKKSHPLRKYMTNGGKNEKKYYFVKILLCDNLKILLCDNFPSALFISLTPIFQGQFGVIGCMILMKEFVSLTTAAMEIRKRYFFNNHWKILQEQKCFIKNMNLTDANYHWKNWVDWILDTWWNKTLKPQKGIFSVQKVK